jgi:hypothetical protein
MKIIWAAKNGPHVCGPEYLDDGYTLLQVVAVPETPELSIRTQALTTQWDTQQTFQTEEVRVMIGAKQAIELGERLMAWGAEQQTVTLEDWVAEQKKVMP